MADAVNTVGGRKLAVVTGASTGIGLELARCAAEDGCDLIIVANEAAIESAAHDLRAHGGQVEALEVDLSTEEGVLMLWNQVGIREVDYLMANAGAGQGHAFVEQDWPKLREAIGLNVTGTTLLIHRALPRMLARKEGRILITGSIAGYMPGAFQAVYNATKAYLDSISYAIREEIKDQDTEVTITCLMPGATDTAFFERADMEDTPVGSSDSKASAADVAKAGYEAMKAGKSGIVPGLMNKLITTFAGVIPETILARMHRAMSEPASNKD